MSNFWNNSCSLSHIWIYYMTPFLFNLGLSLTLMPLPTLLIRSSSNLSIIFPLEKVTVQGKRQIMINFISLAGLRSHVCEGETATSLPTITGKTTCMPLESSEEIKVSESWKCIRRWGTLNLLNPLECQHCFGCDGSSGRSLEDSGV